MHDGTAVAPQIAVCYLAHDVLLNKHTNVASQQHSKPQTG